MSCIRQSFCLFHVSNLSVRNFRISPLMYSGPMTATGGHSHYLIPHKPRPLTRHHRVEARSAETKFGEICEATQSDASRGNGERHLGAESG